MRRLVVAVALMGFAAAACADGGVGSAGRVTTLPAPDPPVEVQGTTTDPTSPPTTGISDPGTTAGVPSTTTVPPEIPPAPPRPTRVYFLLDSDDPFRPGPLLVPVHREIPDTLAVATNSIVALLGGPTAAESAAAPGISTAIPEGVALNGIVIAEGLATVDLSAEFETTAGSFAEEARLGQVVYTLTQFPTVDAVEFRVDGSPVELIAGHGIDIGEPQTRAGYEALLPFIFVDGPAYGGTADNPARVTGVASVFEATFSYVLRDADGRVLDEGAASGGSGLGFGPFDFSISYDVATPQVGSLTVFEVSALTGEMINVREYPVEVVPAA